MGLLIARNGIRRLGVGDADALVAQLSPRDDGDASAAAGTSQNRNRGVERFVLDGVGPTLVAAVIAVDTRSDDFDPQLR